MIKETHRHEATDGSKQIDRIDLPKKQAGTIFIFKSYALIYI